VRDKASNTSHDGGVSCREPISVKNRSQKQQRKSPANPGYRENTSIDDFRSTPIERNRPSVVGERNSQPKLEGAGGSLQTRKRKDSSNEIRDAAGGRGEEKPGIQTPARELKMRGLEEAPGLSVNDRDNGRHGRATEWDERREIKRGYGIGGRKLKRAY